MKAQVNGIDVHYELEGPTGAPVITFSHSLAADLYIWDAQVAQLSDQYRILRYDTRGHGGTSASPGLYTMEMLVADAVALLDRLDIERTHFVGISMGGMIGQLLAIHLPHRLDSLVLCDTMSRVPPETGPIWDERVKTAESKGMTALSVPTLLRWLSSDFRRANPDETERIRNMISKTQVAGYVGCCNAIRNFNVADRLGTITVRTLIMVGENDPVATVSAAKEMKKEIQGAELVVLPEALHLANVEAADACTLALRDFLSKAKL